MPSNKEEKSRNPVFLKVSEQYRTALRRAKDHALVDDEGNSSPMSRSMLQELSELSEGTISNLLVSDKAAKDKPPNPTLEVICKTAAALNVPPAMLLMTSDDWEKLAIGVAEYMNVHLQSEMFKEYVNKTVLHPKYLGRPADIARDAYTVAEMTYGTPAKRAKAAINTISQTVPFNKLSHDAIPLFMVMCSVFAMSAKNSASASGQ